MNRRRWILLGVLLVGTVVAGQALLQNALTTHPSNSYLHVSATDTDQQQNRTVVAFEDLTAEQQRVFEEAVHGDSNVEIPDGVSAEVWIENDAVRYRNQTYEVNVAVA